MLKRRTWLSDPIRGAVARVLNRRELAINRGDQHGVRRGMVFAVLNTQGSDITDPETDEPLGSVDLPKVLVKIVRTQDRLSVGRTFKTRRRNVGGSGVMLGDIFTPSRWIEEPETFEAGERTYQEEIDEEESFVKRGDPVVQMVGEEYET